MIEKKPISVLFVDDEEYVVEMVQAMLSKRYENIYVAYNGEEGLQQFKTHKPDVVITDLTMPIMNGFEMIKEIKEIDPDTYFIVASAHNEANYLIDSINLGIQNYLIKPLKIDSVTKFIDENYENILNREKLKELNRTLEKRVQEEIAKNEEQTKLMFQQAKYAQMGEMLSMIAHQWRQPLNAVSSAAINLKMEVELGTLSDENVITQAEFIEKQTAKMSDTINDFMNFFKPEKDKHEFLIKTVVDEVRNIIKAQLNSRSIEFLTEMDESLKIVGFKNEFEHILLNIIANARDAFEEKSIENKQIKIRSFQDGGNIKIEVFDNAGGISDEIMDKIFNPYFTTKLDINGTGIGLYMTKIMVERNFKGDISASNINGGALFTIVIPAEL